MKVLMVCLGNICRSPMADGLLRIKAEEQGLDITVDSAGTGAYHAGEAPDKRMRETATNRGIDISMLRARQFEFEDFEDFDLIYAMDGSNYRHIIAMAESEDHKTKVKMILNETHPGSDMGVPDPYYGGDQGFEEVFNLLDDACNVIIEKLKG